MRTRFRPKRESWPHGASQKVVTWARRLWSGRAVAATKTGSWGVCSSKPPTRHSQERNCFGKERRPEKLPAPAIPPRSPGRLRWHSYAGSSPRLAKNLRLPPALWPKSQPSPFIALRARAADKSTVQRFRLEAEGILFRPAIWRAGLLL